MNYLSDNQYYELVLKTPISALPRLCATNKAFARVCADNHTWQALIKRDFGVDYFGDHAKEVYRSGHQNSQYYNAEALKENFNRNYTPHVQDLFHTLDRKYGIIDYYVNRYDSYRNPIKYNRFDLFDEANYNEYKVNIYNITLYWDNNENKFHLSVNYKPLVQKYTWQTYFYLLNGDFDTAEILTLFDFFARNSLTDIYNLCHTGDYDWSENPTYDPTRFPGAADLMSQLKLNDKQVKNLCIEVSKALDRW